MLWNALVIALREIRRNPTRAFLTVLGIVIGVASVVTMVTLGRGATSAVRDQISSIGSNLVMIRPGQGFGPGTNSAGIPLFRESDADAIRDRIHDVQAVSPVTSTSRSTTFNGNARTTTITGTTPDWFSMNRWSLADGRFFHAADLKASKAVCVIGQTVRKELFPSKDPIGERLRIGSQSVEIIGILQSKGQAGFGPDQDDTIVMPLTTVRNRLTGRSSEQSISQILVSTTDSADSEQVMSAITALMRPRRHLTASEDDDFSVVDTRQIAETLSSSTRIMTMLLAAVAAVSMLVGGIGIMNIMLVSVTERTREIGIRLAIGARAREVLLQFLVEAVTLSSAGGLLGLAFAAVLCLSLAAITRIPVSPDATVPLLSFAFSALIGIAFGFMPARRAAALDPIEALRHE